MGERDKGGMGFFEEIGLGVVDVVSSCSFGNA
jgi:hypothetical protein